MSIATLRGARLIPVVAALLLAGCAMWRPVTVPIRVVTDAARCAKPPDTLLVMLPGTYSLPEEFEQEGFVRLARERHLAADIVLVDAHLGYYRDKSIVDRLHEDVVGPARAKGYRHVWLVGISLGGVGAMLYANAHPEEVAGVVLIAPYLGTRLTAQEIHHAGGLARWPAPAAQPDEDIDPILWRWLQSRKLPLFLGYGTEDRFVYNDAVLSEALPPSQVFTTPGGHDWPPWRAAWGRIVGALPVAVDASCALGG